MKSIKTELKWAFLFIGMELIWMMLERLAGLHGPRIHLHPYLTMLFLIPAIVMFVLALRDKRNGDFGGRLTYGKAFRSGLIITAFITLLTPPAQWVISEIITPDFFTNVIAYTTEHGLMTEEAARAQFNLRSYIINSTISAPLMGIIITAIASFFARKS